MGGSRCSPGAATIPPRNAIMGERHTKVNLTATEIMKSKRIALGGLVAVLMLAAAAAGVVAWWRGRPERHLAEAERRLAAGSWDSAARWLELPARVAATRERA